MGHEAVVMKQVTKAFGSKVVLQDISLQIHPGEIYGILGPSGCGKTTVIKVMTGMLPCSAGTVQILGEPMPQRKMLHRIGYMAQSDALYLELTARENLEFFGQIYGMDKARRKARIAETLQMVDLLPHLDVPVKSFSGGMKRRLSLAGALLHEPELIVLDEPTVGIDPLLRKKIWQKLTDMATAGSTIVMTTHVMDEAARCNRLAMMRDGRLIAQGTPQQMMEITGTGSIEEAFIYYGGEQYADSGTDPAHSATNEA